MKGMSPIKSQYVILPDILKISIVAKASKTNLSNPSEICCFSCSNHTYDKHYSMSFIHVQLFQVLRSVSVKNEALDI